MLLTDLKLFASPLAAACIFPVEQSSFNQTSAVDFFCFYFLRFLELRLKKPDIFIGVLAILKPDSVQISLDKYILLIKKETKARIFVASNVGVLFTFVTRELHKFKHGEQNQPHKHFRSLFQGISCKNIMQYLQYM